VFAALGALKTRDALQRKAPDSESTRLALEPLTTV
jgi:hypothetical protein